MGIFGSHTGSWGLPDFGITEGISKLIGGTSQTNNTGGSNLVGSYQLAPQQQGTVDYVNQMNKGGTNIYRQGAVLGASTGGGGSVGGGVSSTGTVDTGGDTGGQYVDPYADLRNDISSGWDSYLSSLDQQLYGLTGQKTSQESIANSQFNQGLGDLDLQKTQGFQQLGTQRQQVEQNQAKNLRDLGANLKNSFMAGNVYLGSRGAGDSSAANQYAFALTKMGSRQRGDIMNNTSNILSDIAGRETNLTNIYNTEKNKLQEALNQQIQGIAQWFANAQNTIQMQKAQGQLNKSQDLASLSKEILNYAMGQLQTVQQAAQQRQAGLESWAMSNSQNLAQLKQNMGAISNPSYQLPQSSSITGIPQFTSDGRIFVPTGYGTDTEKKKTTVSG